MLGNGVDAICLVAGVDAICLLTGGCNMLGKGGCNMPVAGDVICLVMGGMQNAWQRGRVGMQNAW